MKRFQLYVFDLDGTIYRGNEPVQHASFVIQELLSRGSIVRYFTNNSATHPLAVSEKLNRMGVACEPSWVYGTGPLAVQDCLKHGDRSVFVVGEPELREMFLRAGFEISDTSPNSVVVGICRLFSYELLDKASSFVRKGARLVITNRDATYPVEGGREQPGAGSIAAAMEVASNTFVPDLGKPNTALLDWILSDLQINDPSSVLVIGDRMDTDIECGKRAGCATWLALTGVTKYIPSRESGGADLRELLVD